MENDISASEFNYRFPAEWVLLKSLLFKLKLKGFLVISAVILAATAILAYFFVSHYHLEIAIILLVLGLSAIYVAIFRIPKNKILQERISSCLVPLLIHSKSWNIEYENQRRPYFAEFKASRLYPYTITSINGSHYFSGIARKLPFIAWFVEANYTDKVGESPLSMVSTRSEFNGFLGIQIIVKNLRPELNGIVAITKSDEEDLKALSNFYKADSDWKALKTDDLLLKKKFVFYTPVQNPANELNIDIIRKINQLYGRAQHPFSLSIRRGHNYLNLYFQKDPWHFDRKLNLIENIRAINKHLEELTEISFILALPS